MPPAAFPPLKPTLTRGACATETGPFREWNEDACAFFDDEMASLGIVADGCGGNSSGHPAAEITIATARTLFEARRSSIVDDLAEAWWRAEHESSRDVALAARARPYDALPIADRVDLRDRVTRLLEKRVPDAIGDIAALEAERRLLLDVPRRALLRSNDAIQRASQSDRSLRGMGAAAMIAMVSNGEVAISHVGDCRAFRIRPATDEIDVITEEHSLVNAYKRAPDHDPEQLREIMEAHPNVIVQALGTGGSDPQPETVVSPAVAGDWYVLTTDGLWKLFPEVEIRDAVKRFGIGAAAYLVRLGSRELPNHPGDNLSLVVVQIL